MTAISDSSLPNHLLTIQCITANVIYVPHIPYIILWIIPSIIMCTHYCTHYHNVFLALYLEQRIKDYGANIGELKCWEDSWKDFVLGYEVWNIVKLGPQFWEESAIRCPILVMIHCSALCESLNAVHMMVSSEIETATFRAHTYVNFSLESFIWISSRNKSVSMRSLWKKCPLCLRSSTTSWGLGRADGLAPTNRVYVGTRDFGIWQKRKKKLKG